MKNERMMVMPPIYRFSLEGYPKESNWGWHRATELVETINNILALRGESPMSPIEINEAYPFAKLNYKNDRWFCSPVVGADRDFGGTNIGSINWLNTLVNGDLYLPARLGMTLINAVKHPVVSSIKNLFSNET